MAITISVSIDSDNVEIATAAAGLAYLAACCDVENPPVGESRGLEAVSLILLWASDAIHETTGDRKMLGGPLNKNDRPWQEFSEAAANLFEVTMRLQRFLGYFDDEEKSLC